MKACFSLVDDGAQMYLLVTTPGEEEYHKHPISVAQLSYLVSDGMAKLISKGAMIRD